MRLSQSSGSTPRTGRNTGGHDARSRPGAVCETARGNRPHPTFRIASGMYPSHERDESWEPIYVADRKSRISESAESLRGSVFWVVPRWPLALGPRGLSRDCPLMQLQRKWLRLRRLSSKTHRRRMIMYSHLRSRRATLAAKLLSECKSYGVCVVSQSRM